MAKSEMATNAIWKGDFFFYYLLREDFLLFELTLEVYNICLGFQGFAIIEKNT